MKIGLLTRILALCLVLIVGLTNLPADDIKATGEANLEGEIGYQCSELTTPNQASLGVE